MNSLVVPLVSLLGIMEEQMAALRRVSDDLIEMREVLQSAAHEQTTTFARVSHGLQQLMAQYDTVIPLDVKERMEEMAADTSISITNMKNEFHRGITRCTDEECDCQRYYGVKPQVTTSSAAEKNLVPSTTSSSSSMEVWGDTLPTITSRSNNHEGEDDSIPMLVSSISPGVRERESGKGTNKSSNDDDDSTGEEEDVSTEEDGSEEEEEDHN